MTERRATYNAAAIPEPMLARHLAILGMTGSGKTSTGKLAIEQVVPAGSRVCILDPVKSDHWGLTSSADGKRPGLAFHILGGPHGHVALHSGAGAAIAELVARGKLPLSIIDMADFEAGGLQRFFCDFASTLLKRMKGVLYLVIEEAHEFAPKERAGFEKENMALHFAKKLATAGRSKGIRLIVMTQRTQSLHNALLGSCESMIAHRMIAAADQEPVMKWLKGQSKDAELRAEVAESLASLPTGSGWMCSGEAKIFERRAFPRIKTFDNSATPDSDDDDEHVARAAVDRDALRALIGTAVDEAEANDPKKLKAHIANLEREVKTLIAASPRENVKAATDALAASDDIVDELRATISRVQRDNAALEQHRDACLAVLERVQRQAQDARTAVLAFAEDLFAIGEATPGYVKPLVSVSVPAQVAAKRPPLRLPAATPAPRLASAGSESAVRRMLIALAQNPDGVTHRKLGILADVKPGGSTWRAVMARFRREQLVDEPGADVMRINRAGLSELGEYDPLPTGAALREYWRSQIGNGTRGQLFDAVLAGGGRPVSAADVAAAASVELGGSTWRAHMAKLRALELVSGSAELTASEFLFE